MSTGGAATISCAIRCSETYTDRGMGHISKVSHLDLSSHFNPLEMITYSSSK
jgi:hypothetical protein